MTLPKTMRAVRLTGHGGYDKLDCRDDVPVPEPGPAEVLIQVGACGVNNTDINTRVGWYSKQVSGATSDDAGDGDVEADAGWGGSGLALPRIQGADVAGRIVAVGTGVPAARMGERVIVDPILRDPGDPGDRTKSGYYGSERDGGFAEYTVVPAVNAFAVDCPLSDAELASFPCSYSTAEYMLTRADLKAGESVVVTGASGGVGSALVQLAKRRGAFVVAIAGRAKCDAVRAVGADVVVARDAADLEEAIQGALPAGEADVAADVVGGDGFPFLIDTLRRGGRYVTSGAIAGPMVDLDLRTLYLRDLTLYGTTVMPEGVFGALVGYIERGEIRPLVAATYPLDRLAEAQQAFLEKAHVGNIVMLPK